MQGVRVVAPGTFNDSDPLKRPLETRSVADGEFFIEPVESDDVLRASALMREYLDFPLGFVDATVIALAERLGAREILTTDRRHFAAVRTERNRLVSLVP